MMRFFALAAAAGAVTFAPASTAKRYADYQAKTERQIPVVVLEPQS